MATSTTRFWRYTGLAVPILLWLLFFAVLFQPLRLWLSGARTYDNSYLQEWIDETRISGGETLPEMVTDYQKDLKKAADYQKDFEKVPDTVQRDNQETDLKYWRSGKRRARLKNNSSRWVSRQAVLGSTPAVSHHFSSRGATGRSPRSHGLPGIPACRATPASIRS